jgi:hypothetical protein
MKNMIFPKASHFQIPKALFIGAWKVWFKRFGEHDAWRKGRMPIGQSDENLSTIINAGQRFTLEVASRLMVPWSFRDCSQIDEAFFLMNPDVIRHSKVGGTDDIEVVRLTDQAVDFWDSLTYLEQDMFTAYAEARVQADIETPSAEPVIIDDAGVEVIGEDIYPPVIPVKDDSDEDYARALVAWIDDDPFTPMYQRQPAGETVSSWHDRLEHFFWPKPRNGLMQVSHSADALMYRAELLARGIDDGVEWNDEDKAMAIKTAEEIFLQAGVPQKDVNWESIQDVMKAALNKDTKSKAKMNSGWSLLASFSTHWLNKLENRTPMICWNSRVSTSIISRLDFLMVEAGFDSVGSRFPELGVVQGWGGTRPREMSLKWPDGYRSWKTEVAASEFVGLMVDCLNNDKNEDGSLKYAQMPIPTGGRAPWSIQGVQLVLFSDGY